MSFASTLINLVAPGLLLLLLIAMVATQRANPERYRAMLADAAEREKAQARSEERRRGGGDRHRRRHRSRRDR